MHPRGPVNDDAVDRRGLPQAETWPWVELTVKASASLYLSSLRASGSMQTHSSTDRIAVTRSSFQVQANPVGGIACVIAPEAWRVVEICSDDIRISVIVEVDDGGCTAGAHSMQARFATDFPKTACLIVVEEIPLSIGETANDPLQRRIHMAIGNEQIEPAIVIKVREGRRPTEKGAHDPPHARS